MCISTENISIVLYYKRLNMSEKFLLDNILGDGYLESGNGMEMPYDVSAVIVAITKHVLRLYSCNIS